jgi:hypothetical protein
MEKSMKKKYKFNVYINRKKLKERKDYTLNTKNALFLLLYTNFFV